MRDKIEAQVRKVVLDLLNSKRTKQDTLQTKNLFILLDEQLTTIPTTLIKPLLDLSETYNLTICSAQSINQPTPKSVVEIHLHTQNINQLKSEIEKTDIFILANPQFSHLAKLSLSIDDTLGMWLLFQMQSLGKKIIFINDYIFGSSDHSFLTMPYKVNKRIHSYISQLRNENVSFLSFYKLEKWLVSYFESHIKKRQIVLARHIKEAKDRGLEELIIPKGSLLTPMCKETAKEQGITLRQKE